MIALLNKILTWLSAKIKIRADLIAHFALCFTFAMIGGYYGAAFGMGWGVGKEHGDSNSPVNKWDNMDLLSDALGTATGLLVNWLLKYFYYL